jgi:hypothetical protein
LTGVPQKTFTLKDLKKLLPEDILTEFLNVCYECGSELRHDGDGMLVCSSCGREFNDGCGEVESTIPISDESSADGHAESHWSPQSMIAFTKGLGTNNRITNSAMCRIIATGRDHDGQGDTGLRAAQIRILTNKVDHPDIQNMLSFASQLCNDYGMHNRRLSSLVFAEDLGRWVRAIGAMCILRNDPYENRRRLVRSAFYLLFAQYYSANAEKVREDLKVKPEDVDYVKFLINQYRLREKHSPRGLKAIESLFCVGFGLLRQHGLASDEGFCKSYSQVLFHLGLGMLLHGYRENEPVAKAAIALTAEKLWGREKASELMARLGISERMLGQVETLAGQKPAFFK